ncbi:hypothetical protein [Undibacterium sp. Ren11W]|uniref:hypothetical protein n=1 Tax=Undibacterium sp. Ren11W TaxID=3413045 RepID=UPI003BF1BEF7
MNEEELKSIWQSQAVDNASCSFETLERETMGFRRKIAQRNIQERIAAVAVALIFGFYAWHLPVLLMRIGSGIVVFGSLFILYHLQHKTSLRELPPENLALPNLTYFRDELMRQRDALRNLWLWMIPTLLGMSVFFWGWAQPDPADFPWSITSVIIVPFGIVIVMNFLAAHKLQAKINQLDQLDK